MPDTAIHEDGVTVKTTLLSSARLVSDEELSGMRAGYFTAAGAHFDASRPAAHVMPAGEFIFGLGVIGPDPLVPETDFRIKDGHVTPPTGAGLGIVVDEQALRRRLALL